MRPYAVKGRAVLYSVQTDVLPDVKKLERRGNFAIWRYNHKRRAWVIWYRRLAWKK